jgi:serine/threonine protein kinase/tetratricopeptide (TPR) repeat protein
VSVDESSAPEGFGPYVVYERLGVGGMATVHRAKKRGIAGFERGVVLKRILPHLAEDAEFINSFVREAKLASMLVHPNIAQIYDFGRVGSVYFIATEHVDGFDVRKMLRYSNRHKEPLPLNVVMSTLCELCDALEYAHTFVDEHGTPQGIVHCDVSPSNLIVAQSGHLKVIDFGIATVNVGQLYTERGRVKGKLGYMSPEAVSGRPFGPVSDVFSAGVVAHELLTAHPLFSAKTDYDTLIRIHEAEIPPPSRRNPSVPAALDDLVLAALARDSERRLQTAGAFRQGLEYVAEQAGIRFSARDVAEWRGRISANRWDPDLPPSTIPYGRKTLPSLYSETRDLFSRAHEPAAPISRSDGASHSETQREIAAILPLPDASPQISMEHSSLTSEESPNESQRRRTREAVSLESVEQLREVRDLIARVFLPADLEMLVHDHLGVPLAHLVSPGTHLHQVFELLQVCESRGWLDTLLDGVAAERQQNPEVALLMQRLGRPITSSMAGGVAIAAAGARSVSAVGPDVPAHALSKRRDDELQALVKQLDDAYARQKQLDELREPTAELTREILDLKRKLREGGQLRPGDRLGSDGRYQLIQQVGRGGFAVVWKAKDRREEIYVAIKVLHTNLAGDPHRSERFFRGARMMQRLDHPAVARVLDPRCEDGGFWYFVMEHVTNGTLHDAVLQKRMAGNDALIQVIRIGEALALAHAHGIVHRDIKPANILLDKTLEAKLTDFDLVGAGDTTGGTRTSAMGTVIYAAPECLETPQDATARADVFGLGMTGIFALAGKMLTLSTLRNPDPTIAGLDCSEDVKDVLRRAVAWEPEERFADGGELVAALKNAQAEPKRAPVASAMPSDVPPSPEMASRNPAVTVPVQREQVPRALGEDIAVAELSSSQPGFTHPRAETTVATSTHRLLLVDYDHQILKGIATALRKVGFRVSTAPSVQSAVDALELHIPDLIISEIELPDATGFDLLQQVRTIPKWSEIRFVVLTANSRIQQRLRARSLDADDYLVKPLSMKDLVTRIRTLLARRRTRSLGQPSLHVAPHSTADSSVAAEEAFKRGELALKREHPREAAIEFQTACDLNPYEGDYAGMLAWANFCAAGDKAALSAKTLQELEHAIFTSTRPELALFSLGQAERMLGRYKDALDHFQEVLTLKPNHVEAASEVRATAALRQTADQLDAAALWLTHGDNFDDHLRRLILLCDRLADIIGQGGPELRALVRSSDSPAACADAVAGALAFDAEARRVLAEVHDPSVRLALTALHVERLLSNLRPVPGSK